MPGRTPVPCALSHTPALYQDKEPPNGCAQVPTSPRARAPPGLLGTPELPAGQLPKDKGVLQRKLLDHAR